MTHSIKWLKRGAKLLNLIYPKRCKYYVYMIMLKQEASPFIDIVVVFHSFALNHVMLIACVWVLLNSCEVWRFSPQIVSVVYISLFRISFAAALQILRSTTSQWYVRPLQCVIHIVSCVCYGKISLFFNFWHWLLWWV